MSSEPRVGRRRLLNPRPSCEFCCVAPPGASSRARLHKLAEPAAAVAVGDGSELSAAVGASYQIQSPSGASRIRVRGGVGGAVCPLWLAACGERSAGQGKAEAILVGGPRLSGRFTTSTTRQGNRRSGRIHSHKYYSMDSHVG